MTLSEVFHSMAEAVYEARDSVKVYDVPKATVKRYEADEFQPGPVLGHLVNQVVASDTSDAKLQQTAQQLAAIKVQSLYA